jgi:hypothetical protein
MARWRGGGRDKAKAMVKVRARRGGKAKMSAAGAAVGAVDGENNVGDADADADADAAENVKSIIRKNLEDFFLGAQQHAWYYSVPERSQESHGRYVGAVLKYKGNVDYHAMHTVETLQKFRLPGKAFSLAELQEMVDNSLAVAASETRPISLVLMTNLLDDEIQTLIGDKPCLLLKSGIYFRIRTTAGVHHPILLHCETASGLVCRLITNGQEWNVHPKKVSE